MFPLLLVLACVIFSRSKIAIKETFDQFNDFPSIRKSQAWLEVLKNGNGNFNQLLMTMPADLAMLTYVNQHPDLQENIEREMFPEDSVTRSSFLEPAQMSMKYDDRLQALQQAKFTFLNDPTMSGHEQVIRQALKSDPICRGVFAKVLMNDDLFGCLMNNLKIGGDLDYCFFDYFSKHPDDFRELRDGFHRFKSGPLPDSSKTPDKVGTTPITTSLEAKPTMWQTEMEGKDESLPSMYPPKEYPSRVTQMCLTSYGPFPRQGQAMDKLARAKQAIDKLKKESAIKSFSIKNLKKDLIDNREELSSIRRACGYQYMPTSKWLSQDLGDCQISMKPNVHKPIMPYQSLSFSEVPRQQRL